MLRINHLFWLTVRFNQSRLTTTLSLGRDENDKIEYYMDPILYSSSTVHPLIYPDNHEKVGQVCLREYDKDPEFNESSGAADHIAKLFMANRHTLFYGTNLTTFFDNNLWGPGQMLVSLIDFGAINPHAVRQRKLKPQRMSADEVKQQGLMVISYE